MRKCIDCYFWYPTGLEPYQGYCKLGSIECITAVFNHKPPTRFLEKDDDQTIPKPQRDEEGKIGRRSIMSSEETADAQRSRMSNIPQYPDMRTLTDESKAELRKLGKRRK